jgi:hypothetical protein
MKQESKELILAPTALLEKTASTDMISEAISANVVSGELSELVLPRIKISGGAKPRWIVPSLEEDEQMLDELTGVVVYARDTRVYYREEMAEGSTSQPPNCMSLDCITGSGDPGGSCKQCPLSKYGSAAKGKGQACKLVRQLFFIFGDQALPVIVSLPPTSIKPCRLFFLKLATRGMPYYRALITIGIESAQNAAGYRFGRATFRFVRQLQAKEASRAMEYYTLCRNLAQHVGTGLDPESRVLTEDAEAFDSAPTVEPPPPSPADSDDVPF